MRKHRAKLIALALLSVIGLGGYLWASSGNSGTIYDAPAQTAVNPRSDQTLDGLYMTFAYSGRYQAEALSATNQDLELYMLTANTNYEKRLSVAVSTLPNGQLTSHSAYLLRKSQPAEFPVREVDINGNKATIFQKKDNSEQTVFLPRDNKVAVLSFTTTADFDSLTAEVTKVIESFKWKG